jgi:uncharacterized protein with PQ loop repeat
VFAKDQNVDVWFSMTMRIVKLFGFISQVFETETDTEMKMAVSPVYITILQLDVYLWSTNAICYLTYDL